MRSILSGRAAGCERRVASANLRLLVEYQHPHPLSASDAIPLVVHRRQHTGPESGVNVGRLGPRVRYPLGLWGKRFGKGLPWCHTDACVPDVA
eukprot:scaffold69135_cov82-Phaeocystis_antarctica.AAC.1